MSSSDKEPRKKRNTAAALRYRPGEDFAPVVVASGHGEIAERIIRIADENDIPCYRDDSAAALLTMLKVGSPVPEELYQVVAAVYAEVLRAADNVRTQAKAKEQPAEE